MLFLCFQMDQHTQKGLSMSDLSIYTLQHSPANSTHTDILFKQDMYPKA